MHGSSRRRHSQLSATLRPTVEGQNIPPQCPLSARNSPLRGVNDLDSVRTSALGSEADIHRRKLCSLMSANGQKETPTDFPIPHSRNYSASPSELSINSWNSSLNRYRSCSHAHRTPCPRRRSSALLASLPAWAEYTVSSRIKDWPPVDGDSTRNETMPCRSREARSDLLVIVCRGRSP